MANEAVAMVTTATPSTLLLVLIALTLSCDGQQQTFIEMPHNISVVEGQTAVMRCIVGHQQGRVNWGKHGERRPKGPIEYDRIIPDYPHYSIIGNAESGEHFLRIENATMDDDASYQCQVRKSGEQNWIQANAHLTILSPPASVEIQNYKPGARVQTRVKEKIVLECLVRNAKPAAEIVWFKHTNHNSEIKFAAIENKVEESGLWKRFDTRSKVTIRVQADDNDADYTCEARHPTLIAPKNASITLDVLYPPGPPEILDDIKGETVRMGQEVNLVCVSRGGHPVAQIVWYKNDVEIDSSFVASGRESRNTFSFRAQGSDNNARFRCEASNQMSKVPLKAEIIVTVHFAPTRATVSDSQIIFIAVSTAGSVLLLLIVILIMCYFVRRHKNKKERMKETMSSERVGSKSATTEMYCLSTYNETVNGETLNSVLKESESYSQTGIRSDYAPEDATKVAANTCLIDQTDGQVAYGSYRVGGLQNPAQGTLTRPPKYLNSDIDQELENYMDTLRRNTFTQSGTLRHRSLAKHLIVSNI